MPSTPQSSRFVTGIGINTGKIAGRLHFFHSEQPPKPAKVHRHPREERCRLELALRETASRLKLLRERTLAELSEELAEIFEIHAMVLEDEDFTEALFEALTANTTAEDAVISATDRFAARFRSMDDPYLSARANDIADLREQLLEQLAGAEKPAVAEPQESYILVAPDLTPSQTVTLDKSRILGFVTFGGTPSSHTAILARAMGIPALVGVGELPASMDGCFALLDAAEGRLTLSPDAETLRAFEQSRREENELAREHDRYLRSLINKPAVTRSGHRMLIYANVGDSGEAAAACAGGADGVGLLRTELLYLTMDHAPTEEELYVSYRKTVEAMNGKRIVFRTLDAGADKQIPYLNLPREENPALGFRAVRLCLAREELFKEQLRAILRASAYGTVSLMIPMIVSVEEVRNCRRLLEECKAELQKEGKAFDNGMEFGIMIETPAAAVMCRELAEEVNFFSIGTNDLTQYTLAADRQNPYLASLCERNREPVLRLIEESARAIHGRGGWIGICGEMAADLRLTQRFADMRIDELSVSVPYLLGVREKVIECK
ncbi:MAG: phosphoenolpyruvate--protein phosphotransferase [Ruminococcaceae bacterium]|nr:phosphoenolpyruvate--protein phosphotransferase [Oscillospiraceae bacterium]